jgi:ABC-type nitrate/sulfonate/bicarbonate transport system permease component
MTISRTVLAQPSPFSSKAASALALGQFVIFLVLWYFSPFVFLPTPIEVFQAFGELWANGLGADLLSSFGLNLQAIGFSAFFALLDSLI